MQICFTRVGVFTNWRNKLDRCTAARVRVLAANNDKVWRIESVYTRQKPEKKRCVRSDRAAAMLEYNIVRAIPYPCGYLPRCKSVSLIHY